MASLDINALLKPIPGADPGGPHPSQVRDKDPMRDPTSLDRLRREAIEKGNEGPVNDPARIKAWRDCMKLAQDLFATRCKNLDWAIYAVDTAVRSGGFAAAREGFQFLTKLTNECWEWLWPRPNLQELEDAEPDDRDSLRKELEGFATEARAGRFQSLDDPGSGLLFPNVFREWIIVEHDGAAVSVNTCLASAGRPAKLSSEDLQAVARKVGPERIREVIGEIEGALSDLEVLRQATEAHFLEANAVDLAPSFREIRTALEECRKVTDELAAAVEVDAEPAQESAAAGSVEESSGGVPATGGGARDKLSRAALYKQIAQIADHLMRIEPHSPVPHLLRRVVEIQDLPFPELVRQFTYSGEAVLGFLERSLKASPSGE
jgi:type VI secretion system protein ImpA